MTQNQRVPRRAITLTNVLAAVAVVAVSLCLVVPTLAKIKEPSRRAMCADNLRRMAQGLFAYANDYQGKGPIRGWFNYDIAESSNEAYGWGRSTKVLIGLGMLHKKYNGGQYDMFYCPSTYTTYREGSGGWKSVFDPAFYHTYGGYNYALPFAGRTLASPDFVGPDPFPSAKWDARLVSWINTWKLRNPGATFHVPNNPALVLDFTGGGVSQHAPSMNVMYMDGHVRFHDIGGGSVSNSASFEVWHKVSLKQ